jgi:hypothetical protein
MSSSPTEKPTSGSYKIFRRLPPFYTLQANLQSQSKQISCWGDFILDAAVAAFHQTGALGIQVTPHSLLFRSPVEVNRTLSSKGARATLRSLMENHGGHRCLPLSLEVDGEQQHQQQEDEQENEDEGEYDIIVNEDEKNNKHSSSMHQQQPSSLFLNSDALIVLALPCEKIVQSIWAWHDELQTSNIFSVSEIAEDNDIKKRISKIMNSFQAGNEEQTANDVGMMILNETINCDGNGKNSALQISPLSHATVIGTIMTTEHPAMAHLKRPALLSGAGGSLGLKFG